jgi:hypothetical protein
MIIGINGYAGSGKDTVGALIQVLHSSNTGSLTIEKILADYKNHEWWLEEQSGWEIKKWAGKLKTIASLLTGISQEKFEDQEFKKTYLGSEWNYWTVSAIDNGKLKFQEGRFVTKAEAEGYAGFMEQTYGTFRMEYVVGMQQMTVRQFLQELGTDACRKGLHTNTWVNALMADYKPYSTRGSQYEEVESKWIITDTRFPNEAQAIKDAGGIVIRVDRPGVKPINPHASETSLDNWEFDYKIMNGSDIVSLMFSVYTILKKQGLVNADYKTKNQDVSHS